MSTISQFQYQPPSTSTGSSMCYIFLHANRYHPFSLHLHLHASVWYLFSISILMDGLKSNKCGHVQPPFKKRYSIALISTFIFCTNCSSPLACHVARLELISLLWASDAISSQTINFAIRFLVASNRIANFSTIQSYHANVFLYS